MWMAALLCNNDKKKSLSNQESLAMIPALTASYK